MLIATVSDGGTRSARVLVRKKSAARSAMATRKPSAAIT
jgi:hypothetical protein